MAPHGDPPPLCQNECLRDTIIEEPYTDSWLHQSHSIAAAAALQRGKLWQPTRVETPAPTPRDHSPEPTRPDKKAKLNKKAAQPKKQQTLPETHPTPTTRGGKPNPDRAHVTTTPAVLNHRPASLLLAQTRTHIAQRNSQAQREQSKRIKANRAAN